MFKRKFYHSCRRGEVFLYEDGDAFSVLMKTRIAPGQYNCQAFSTKDYDVAIDKYKEFLDNLNGRTPARTCISNPNRRRKCSAANCPKRLGGAAFWQIFREACLHRTK